MSIRHIIYIIIAFFALTTQAQTADTLRVKREPWALKAFNTVYDFFMGCDTNYVQKVPYDFTAQGELSIWHDYYNMRSSDTGNRMVIESDPSLVAGVSLSYSIFGYGLMYNLNDLDKPHGETNGTSRRQTFTVNTAKLYAELYTFNSGKGAKITHVTDYDLKGKDNRFRGLNSQCSGLSATYFFNNRKYSWPAAFDASAVQRRSAGSWSVGIGMSKQQAQFNASELPTHIAAAIDSTLLFSEVNYNDYCFNIGYNYNHVMRRNCLFALSFLPTIGYRRSNITEAQQQHSILNSISTDLAFRASLSWNTGKYFSAFMLDLHTYSYRKNKFGLTNTYGTMKYLIGFNFW